MYAGITRAQRSLYLSHCVRRKRGKEVRPCEPSRFLDELRQDVVRTARGGATPADKATASQRLAALRALLGNKASSAP